VTRTKRRSIPKMAKREGGRGQWAKWEILVVVGVLAATGGVIALFSSG
jgi:hypothetical protein